VVLVRRRGVDLIPSGTTVLKRGDVVVIGASAYDEERAIRLSERRISSKSKWRGRMIAEFSPDAGELVIMIKRANRIIIPKGDTVIQEHDVLVIHET